MREAGDGGIPSANESDLPHSDQIEGYSAVLKFLDAHLKKKPRS